MAAVLCSKEEAWIDSWGEPAAEKYLAEHPELQEHPERGIIIEVVDFEKTNLEGEAKTCYIYSPIEYCTQPKKLKLWHLNEINQIISDMSNTNNLLANQQSADVTFYGNLQIGRAHV